VLAVRCPWCDARLQAKDERSLSRGIAEHFVRAHGGALDDLGLLGGEEGHLSTLNETDGEGEVRHGPEEYADGATMRGGDVYGLDGPPHVIERRGLKDRGIRCPMCGLEVAGDGEDELSRNLKDHMTEFNELERDRRDLEQLNKTR